MNPAALLEVRNLNVAFQHEGEWTSAVEGLSFRLEAGTALGIVGESGSGKSVSSLAIMQLLSKKNARVQSEGIFFEGAGISEHDEKQMRMLRGSRMAMIFQEPMTSLNPVMRCGKQVMEAILTHHPEQKKTAREKVLKLFEKVLLPRPEAIFEAYPHQLSGGQKQRVMIAMALANEPKLLIADEPTTALDVTVQKEILQLLKALQRETAMAMIFISHDLAVVSEICDEVLVMHKGHVVEQGAVQKVLQSPQHPYTQGLLACRPPTAFRLRRLPVVKEFLANQWPGGLEQMRNELAQPAEERQLRHLQIYSQAPLLRVENLSKRFKLQSSLFRPGKAFVHAVNEVSFEVFQGETLGLVGESGCGKTSLGRSILRLIEPEGGSIFFKGVDITALNSGQLRAQRQKMQIVFQDPYASLNPRIPIGEAIAEPMQVHGLFGNRAARRTKVIELLEEVGLEASHYKRYPHEFSGGQRQRICIARALAVNPELVICDEPVSALDVSVQAQVLNLLNRLKQDYGFTYIFISHDLSVVRYMSDRVMVMNKGKIEELAEADELYRNPQTSYTKKLIEAIPGRKNS